MSHRNALISFAAAAVIAGGTMARAEESPKPANVAELTVKPALLVDAPAEKARPIMWGLDELGAAKPLMDAGVNIYGHIEGSYTYNFDQPDGQINALRAFDGEAESAILNQFDIAVERTLDPKKSVDVGGKVEFIYGSDSKFIHSNGLFDYHSDDANPPENQWDLNQAYVQVGFPVGDKSLTIMAGKFVTLLGQEYINPTGNAFYSHSYLFGFAIPFTHTGILGKYQINDEWTVQAGITRGWEQSTEDNNDAIDFLGNVTYAKDKISAAVAATVGPQQADNNDNYRVVIDVLFGYQISDQFRVDFNADYGWESEAQANGDDAKWYGIAGYAKYVLNDWATLNGRLEWFDDADGTRTGVDANYYEATVGVSIKPFYKDDLGKNLMIRPELRFDLSDEDVFDGDDKQSTIAVDAIFTL